MDKFETVTNADGSVDMVRSDKGLWYDSEEVDARIAELTDACREKQEAIDSAKLLYERIAELEGLLTECLNTNENEHMDPDLVDRINRSLMESVTK